MSRADLLPKEHRAERALLLDLLSGTPTPARFGREADAEAFLSITPEPLYPLVAANLSARSGELDVPRSLLLALGPHYRGSAMLHARRRALLRSTMAILAAAGIDHLLLKGPVLAHTVYAEPATRSMSDLDFLVHPDDLAAAVAALEAAGYHVPPRYFGMTLPAGDAPALEPPGEQGILIELHTILDSTGDDDAALQSAWAGARRLDLGGGLIAPTLGADAFFTHVVMHLSKHHRFESSLRALLDVALLLKAEAQSLQWEALSATWDRQGILPWMTLTIVLAHELLGAPLPPPFVKCDAAVREALPLAAAQLWRTNAQRVPPRLIVTLTGKLPSPTHAGIEQKRVPMPRGMAGVRATVYKTGVRVRKVFAALTNGALRPRNIAESVQQFRERERLAVLMERR